MKQMTLAAAKGFEVHGRATRKAAFLARMEALVPWAEFCALIEPQPGALQRLDRGRHFVAFHVADGEARGSHARPGVSALELGTALLDGAAEPATLARRASLGHVATCRAIATRSASAHVGSSAAIPRMTVGLCPRYRAARLGDSPASMRRIHARTRSPDSASRKRFRSWRVIGTRLGSPLRTAEQPRPLRPRCCWALARTVVVGPSLPAPGHRPLTPNQAPAALTSKRGARPRSRCGPLAPSSRGSRTRSGRRRGPIVAKGRSLCHLPRDPRLDVRRLGHHRAEVPPHRQRVGFAPREPLAHLDRPPHQGRDRLPTL